MKRLIAPLLTVLATFVAPLTASAQASFIPARPVDPARPGGSGHNPSTHDLHRFEMDRLRGVADANDGLASRQSLRVLRALDTLRNRQAPTPPTPPVRISVPPAQPLPPPADTRNIAGGRQIGDVAQIDAWLYRSPH